MPQRAAQQLFIPPQELCKAPLRLRFRLPEQAGGHRRHERQRNDQACEQRIGDCKRHVGKELPRKPLHEHDRQEHADRCKRGGSDGRRHLLSTGDRCLHRGRALAAEAVDVLDHDDRIIHQHADRHRKAGKRDHVERHARKIHQHEREHHADGDRAERNERGPEIPQEQEEDDHGKQSAPQEARKDGIRDDINVVSLIHQRHERKPFIFLRKGIKLCTDVVRNLCRSGGGLLLEGEHHAVVPVDAAVQGGSVIRHKHVRHIPEVNGVHPLHARVKQEQVFQFCKRFDLIAHAHEPAYAVLLHIARRHRKILRLQNVGDHLHRHDVMQIRLLERFRTRFFQLGKAILRLLQRVCQFLFAAFQLCCGAVQLFFRIRFFRFQRFKRFLQLELAAAQVALCALQGRNALVDLRKPLLELRRSRRDIRPGQPHAGKRSVNLSKPRIHARKRRLRIGISGCGVRAGQPLHRKRKIHLRKRGLCRQIFRRGEERSDLLLLFFLAQRHVIADGFHLRFIPRLDRPVRFNDLHSTRKGIHRLRKRGSYRFKLRNGVLELRKLLLLCCERIAHAAKLRKLSIDHRRRLGKLALLIRDLLPRGFGLRFQLLPPVAQLLFAILDLFLPLADRKKGIVKLRLRLLKLGIDLFKQLFIERIEFFLADHNVEVLLDDAACGDARNACGPFKLRQERVLHKARKRYIIHSLHGNSGDHHRQHARVHFEDARRADRILPVPLDLADLLQDVHRDRIHVHVLVEFKDDERIILR